MKRIEQTDLSQRYTLCNTKETHSEYSWQFRKLGKGKGRLIIYRMGEGSLFTGWGLGIAVWL